MAEGRIGVDQALAPRVGQGDAIERVIEYRTQPVRAPCGRGDVRRLLVLDSAWVAFAWGVIGHFVFLSPPSPERINAQTKTLSVCDRLVPVVWNLD